MKDHNKGFTPLQIFGKFSMHSKLPRRLFIGGRFVTGFTLIELLVVIAIVGLLVSIVLVNTRGSRAQAQDANIQTLMHQLRNAAEMSYQRNPESYEDVCDETDNSLTNSGEFGLLETAIKKDNKNQPVVCFESADKKDFAASSPLVYKQGKHWCVESAGFGLEINNSIISAKCQ